MRHGQTQFNAKNIIQGACDSPLTELGIKQAKIAKEYFKNNNVNFTNAYSSTQERASDTLEIITDMPYTRLKGIKEMHFGRFDGESETFHPPKLTEGGIFGEFYATVGGEGEIELRKRMVKTLTEVMNNEGHETVLAVSHGIACYCFYSAFSNEPLSSIPNCTIFKYEYENNVFKPLEIFRPDFKNL